MNIYKLQRDMARGADSPCILPLKGTNLGPNGGLVLKKDDVDQHREG